MTNPSQSDSPQLRGERVQIDLTCGGRIILDRDANGIYTKTRSEDPDDRDWAGMTDTEARRVAAILNRWLGI